MKKFTMLCVDLTTWLQIDKRMQPGIKVGHGIADRDRELEVVIGQLLILDDHDSAQDIVVPAQVLGG